MKKLLGYYLLLSFIAIGLFGFSGLMEQGSFADCASALTNTQMPPCESSGTVAMGLAHVEIYLNFTLALIVAFVALLAVVWVMFRVYFELNNRPFVSNLNRTHQDFLPPSLEKIYKWFDILQHSGPRLSIGYIRVNNINSFEVILIC